MQWSEDVMCMVDLKKSYIQCLNAAASRTIQQFYIFHVCLVSSSFSNKVTYQCQDRDSALSLLIPLGEILSILFIRLHPFTSFHIIFCTLPGSASIKCLLGSFGVSALTLKFCLCLTSRVLSSVVPQVCLIIPSL